MDNASEVNKFDFYEIVTVHSDDPSFQIYNATEVIISGMAQEEDGSWDYGVHTKLAENGFDILPEHVLVKTGRFASRADVYSGDHMVVSSEGKLVSYNGVNIEDIPDINSSAT